MRFLLLLVPRLLVAAACKSEVKIVDYAKVADGSDTVRATFEVKAPAGATVAWKYMVHAHDQHGETLHYVMPIRTTITANPQTGSLTFRRSVLKTATLAEVSVDGAPVCTAKP